MSHLSHIFGKCCLQSKYCFSIPLTQLFCHLRSSAWDLLMGQFWAEAKHELLGSDDWAHQMRPAKILAEIWSLMVVNGSLVEFCYQWVGHLHPSLQRNPTSDCWMVTAWMSLMMLNQSHHRAHQRNHKQTCPCRPQPSVSALSVTHCFSANIIIHRDVTDPTLETRKIPSRQWHMLVILWSTYI